MCFLMMRDCGIRTADSELISVAGRSVILVKRFDVEPAETSRRHFISAHALMYRPRVREGDLDSVFAYPALSDLLLRIGAGSTDQIELYRRLVFNVLVGNTDDHLRNHGLLKNTDDNQYQLSPAYDVVPQPGSTAMQAISIGPGGRYRSLDNCLSAAKYFSLKETEAKQIIDQSMTVLSNWESYAEKVGLSGADRRVLSGAIMGTGAKVDFESLAEQLENRQPVVGNGISPHGRK